METLNQWLTKRIGQVAAAADETSLKRQVAAEQQPQHNVLHLPVNEDRDYVQQPTSFDDDSEQTNEEQEQGSLSLIDPRDQETHATVLRLLRTTVM